MSYRVSAFRVLIRLPKMGKVSGDLFSPGIFGATRAEALSMWRSLPTGTIIRGGPICFAFSFIDLLETAIGMRCRECEDCRGGDVSPVPRAGRDEKNFSNCGGRVSFCGATW